MNFTAGELVAAILGSSVLTAILRAAFEARKTRAEAAKLTAEGQHVEIEAQLRVVEVSESLLSRMQATIERQDQHIRRQDKELIDLRQLCAEYRKEIDGLRERLRRLEHEKGSDT